MQVLKSWIRFDISFWGETRSLIYSFLSSLFVCLFVFKFVQDGVKPKDLKIVRECIEMKNQVCTNNSAFFFYSF